jgi:hypothetical protein
MIAAAFITWCAPQTWDWTRRLPLWKCVLVILALFGSAAFMTVQAFNPFIYFIF